MTPETLIARFFKHRQTLLTRSESRPKFRCYATFAVATELLTLFERSGEALTNYYYKIAGQALSTPFKQSSQMRIGISNVSKL